MTALRQGRIHLDYLKRDIWDGDQPEPTTPLTPTALAAIAQSRADVAVLVENRYGPNSDIAAMLGLDTPLTEVLRDITATTYALDARLGRLLGEAA